jgi:hypothetical protein
VDCRYAPQWHKSRGEITSRAHKLLRDMTVESAWTATRHDPALQMAFTRLCERMPSNRAIIRIARKYNLYRLFKTPRMKMISKLTPRAGL